MKTFSINGSSLLFLLMACSVQEGNPLNENTENYRWPLFLQPSRNLLTAFGFYLNLSALSHQHITCLLSTGNVEAIKLT